MNFSIKRLRAMMLKEYVQMRRDKMTFAMMIGIPVVQLILFGYAINTDPRHLPTIVLPADQGVFVQAIIEGMRQSEYFDFLPGRFTGADADAMLAEGSVSFVVSIPPDFSRTLLRGEQPELLVEADATDPTAVGNALSSLNAIVAQALDRELTGPVAHLRTRPPPVQIKTHLKYNPQRITQFNVVPGLLGVILTMTMVFITSLAVTRERERGTMENLLATPVRPAEVMIGKIIPYIFVGYVQITLILLGARLLFNIPIEGSLPLLLALSLIFIFANLAVGMTFSSLARNQLQAVQLSIFFFLPSILLSGFMFPFRGMPAWARGVGYILPLTHYLPIVRGILLKGNGMAHVLPHVLPLTALMLVALTIGIFKFRQTLD